ncbi:MAG TPA: hypothetical protein VHA52_00900 [Candidatus Babeliaceae bacterium]|nr:hypothetical protein [Candidatus Babeliaceae bacterium]
MKIVYNLAITLTITAQLYPQSHLRPFFNRAMYLGTLVKHQEAKPWRSALKYDWRQALVNYKRTASSTDINRLYEYLTYYRSWYQAVTPPPSDLYESLSDQAKALIKQLKHYAEQFIQHPPARAGATSLSKEGDQWYQNILSLLRSKDSKDNTRPSGLSAL